MPEFIKIYNKGLDKTYNGILSDSICFFEAKVANEIAKDLTTDKTAMSFNKQKDVYTYIDYENSKEGYKTEYQGKNIKIGVFWYHAYPIGNDWKSWSRV